MQRLTLGFVSKSGLAIHEYQVTGPSTTPERNIMNRITQYNFLNLVFMFNFILERKPFQLFKAFKTTLVM